MKINTSKTYQAAVISGILIFAVLFIRYGVVDFAFNTLLSSKIKLAPGNDVWKVWTEMPIPMFSKFYFFNVTNPEQVQNGAKPILNELGPYVYQEKRHKIILESNDDIVKYRPKVTYTFRPDMSHGSQDDNVTLLNVPYVAVAKIAWDVSKEPFMLSTLDDMLASNGETLFHTNKVREFLFDGFSIENYMELLSMPVEAFGVKTDVPDRLLDGDFGFLDDKNDTTSDVWVVGSGVKDVDSLGKIFSFNGRTILDGWPSEHCNRIDDSCDGSIFPPITDTSTVLNIFHPDLCRSIQMSYKEPGEFMEISTWRYSFASNVFGSLDVYPENECFCKETFEWCKKGGVVPLWPCTGGAPVFISKPHFMDAHSDYKTAINGLNENGDYSTVIDIEPLIGLPIRADVKVQLNMELQQISSMATFVNAPNIMFPIFWMEEVMELTEEVAKPLKKILHDQYVADYITQLILLPASIIFFVATIIEMKKSNRFKCCV